MLCRSWYRLLLRHCIGTAPCFGWLISFICFVWKTFGGVEMNELVMLCEEYYGDIEG
jgi:hypothetical protein